MSEREDVEAGPLVIYNDEATLAEALRRCGVEVGSVGGDTFRRVVANRLLASSWLAARDERVRVSERVRLAGEVEALARVDALADEWQTELDTGAIRDSAARYCWSTAARELRAALVLVPVPGVRLTEEE
jgi:hypothetical protein